MPFAEAADHERVHEWASLLDVSSYYELLGVLEIADERAIQLAFHEFALAFHPDVHPGADAGTAALLRRVFQVGAEGYRILSDPALRARYDLALAKGQLRLGGSEVPRVAHVGVGARSLDELCRTASATRFALRADELISQGDLVGAKRELLFAVREDGGNPDLSERLEALDLALFAMGA